MTIVLPLMIFIFAVMVIVHSVYVYQNTKKMKGLTERIEQEQGIQKVLLNALMNKFKKMYIYKEASVSVESREVKALFDDLLAEEDKHLDILKKALLH